MNEDNRTSEERRRDLAEALRIRAERDPDAPPDVMMSEADAADLAKATSGPSRAEHLQWCKDRALAYVDAGDLQGAMTSMMSDIEKHAETKGHMGNQLGLMMMLGGNLNNPGEVRNFINGYN